MEDNFLTIGRNVKLQVRDLHYNTGNLYPNCIISHVLMEWTDHPPGICGWGVRIGVKGIRHKEVSVLRIGLMHVYYSIYLYYLLLFVTHVLSLDKLVDLLMYLSPSVIHCISVELSYVCQTAGAWIGKWLPN